MENNTLLLLIETATSNCSVALSRDGKVLAEKREQGKNIHSSKLTLFIESLMKEEGVAFNELSGVAVSKGPGSYTGLRIGMMAAKGICFGQDIPLMAVNTLKLMAAGFMEHRKVDNNVLLCPMIDARRMEVYYAVFDQDLHPVVQTKAEVIMKGVFDNLLDKSKVCFFGEGIEKCRGDLEKHSNTIFYGEMLPEAAYMAAEAHSLFESEQFVDLTGFEPYYLKDFVPEHPSHKIKDVLYGKR